MPVPLPKLEQPVDAETLAGPLQAKYVEPGNFQQGNKGSGGDIDPRLIREHFLRT